MDLRVRAVHCYLSSSDCQSVERCLRLFSSRNWRSKRKFRRVIPLNHPKDGLQPRRPRYRVVFTGNVSRDWLVTHPALHSSFHGWVPGLEVQ